MDVEAAADSQTADTAAKSDPDVHEHGRAQAFAQHCNLPSLSRRQVPMVESQHSPPQKKGASTAAAGRTKVRSQGQGSGLKSAV